MFECGIEDLKTESDIEQKFILPILVSPPPIGLGYKVSDFKTKIDIRKIAIGKGTSQKLYYPDYVIIIQGLPVAIIEAKKPGEDLNEALREARLYASEINSTFQSNINPCNRVIATDGTKLVASAWDSQEANHIIEYNQIHPTSPAYNKFTSEYSKKALMNFSESIFEKIRGKRKFSRPTSLLGGKTVRLEEFPENGFGANLALEYRNLFNPITDEERANVVRSAYVASKSREKHIDPINKIIFAAKPASMTDAKQIDDSNDPREIYKKLAEGKKLKNELLILIGSVGSGKSTFVDYLKEVALPLEIKKETMWITINLNDAPVSPELIYKWLQKNIISSLSETHKEIDFDELEAIKKLYSVEISKFAKGPAALLPKDQPQYSELLAKKILDLQSDLDVTTKAFVRHLCGERGKLLVIVLDNCDRRNKEEQLLMFNVAKWLKTEYHSLVFLPIRDTTYDAHKTEPPLDTVIKDLVFRIDPPLLATVLYKRIKYAIAETNQVLSYSLSNGIVVKYKQSEQKKYLSCIMRSLFDNDAFFKNLMNGLAGRNIRSGIEIFLDFCKSGHISDDEIFRIRNAHGDYLLPSHLITRVLLRRNKKYYNDDSTHIKNLFASFPEEETFPDPFVRISILQWLKNNFRVYGPNQIKGYHKVNTLLSSLVPLGHADARVRREIETLIKARCILTESQEDSDVFQSTLTGEDLISIAPAGHVHLQLLNNLDYISSCAEDVWYEEIQIAQKVADRLTGKEGGGYLAFISSIENAQELMLYLQNYKKKVVSNPSGFLLEGSFEELINFQPGLETIERSKKQRNFIDYNKISTDFPPNSIHEGQIVSIQKYGIMVELGLNAVGLIHISNISFDITLSEFEIGNRIEIEIIHFDSKYRRFSLKLSSN